MSVPIPIAAIAFLLLLLLPLASVDSTPESQSEELSRSRRRFLVIEANQTVSSENGTFSLGFFSPDNGKSYFLGIWYASVNPPTYIWVANRERPVMSLASAAVEITSSGELAITSPEVIWKTETSSSNEEEGETRLVLFETGNLALVNPSGSILWQSFDFPADTWLPGMNLTAEKGLRSWRSASDPSPGLYSLRMRPGHGEFELVFNDTEPYWLTGLWNGDSFSNVPEMTVPYIYAFRFDRPFNSTASFGFSERALDNGLGIPLTRFRVDPSGLFRQYTWSSQTESWNMFWAQPAGTCRVFGTCGEFGVCGGVDEPCSCLAGFEPVNAVNWGDGDFSDGCRRLRGKDGESDDGFEEVGVSSFFGRGDGKDLSFKSSLGDCKRECLESSDCVGVYLNVTTNRCHGLLSSGESLMNLRNLSSSSELGVGVVYVRVPKEGVMNKEKRKSLSPVVLTAIVVGSVAVLGFLIITLLFIIRIRRKRKSLAGEDKEHDDEEEGVFPALTLKVFSYKELHQVTGGFSEKLGHGGFGAVFRGKLADSTPVAVKRLERPAGGGEKEFRAEVCTIGNIQHVNLVRLRGFCSEDSQRLLVYDFMPNGSLSHYLHRNSPCLSWETRFRIAVETARGIAYLHEECRDCIIHCDIKPENILLDSEFSPKVSDFGLAKLVGRDFSRVLATMRGTWGYVAPEWISGVAITTKADVYSYGMTLIELVGGRRNVEAVNGNANGNGNEKWFFPPWAAKQIIEGNFEAVIDQRLAGEGGEGYDAEELRRVGMVAVWCIQDEESVRPAMGLVVKMLEGVVGISVPPVPKLLQALVSGDSFRGVKADSGGFSPENRRPSSCSESSVSIEAQENSLSFVDKR